MFELIMSAMTFFPDRVFSIDLMKYSESEIEACKKKFQLALERQSSSVIPCFDSCGSFCAFCLISIDPQAVEYCNGCNRRSYCSTGCREKDWTAEGYGQGHKKWCSLKVAEEGIDWEIRSVPNKGFGVIAKKLIPKRSRIMVEVPRPVTSESVLELEPLYGTALEKERLNSFCTGEESLLFVRVARINHSCDSNACQSLEGRTMVVSAIRDIQPGEEICINYTNINGRNTQTDPESARELLLEKWGISCPDDCKCRNQQFINDLRRCRSLDAEIADMLSRNDHVGGLKKVDELLRLLTQIQATWGWYEHIYWAGFTFAVLQDSGLGAAKTYGTEALKLHASVHLPSSEQVDEIVEALDAPQNFRMHLLKHAAQSA